MSSKSESESSDSSTGSSSTRPKHIKEVMTALKHNDQKAPALKPYHHAVHWIPLGINPFANLTAVLFAGLGEEIELEAEDVTEPLEIDKKEELFIFAEIIKMVPNFREILSACAGHHRALLNLIKMLQDSANRARSDDVAKTNTCIVDYLQPLAPEFLNYDKEEVPLPDRTHLEERGWAHLEYGALLYPQILLDSFNPTDYTQTMHDVQIGMSLISESPGSILRLPSSDSVPTNFHGSKDRGRPQIWQEGSGEHGEDVMFNLTRSHRARIVLRGRGWTLEDGAFEYGVFYQNIVRMFEDDHEDDWVKETLAWWQESAPSAAQHTAKKAAQNQVDVAPGEQEKTNVAPGEREEPEVAPGEREQSTPAPKE
ncbi:hypothetical protein M413DRAFT_22983 [Hebeloma cylindrosporum]|uniref:Uncharacterized protein n=1 Tax=Hebeloma cylindrosporum TaxID=76867 RepID=A0A0C3CID9_HEBCY|nr:hypothetical protein M413DRAFT_22983 [Hebeloma cylindrosporum h7]